ncbi:MAG: formate/nitrite transporter family protein [Firmicutes bacterium]|nr:formate/nitrite transporter family protein [Bacillota bacterium]
MLNEYIEKKLSIKKVASFASAIFAGVCLGLVSAFSVVLGTVSSNPALSKLIYGASFTAFLLLVVLNEMELFTGNTMLLAAVHKKGKTKKVLLNLLFVYLGNFVGCVFIAYVIKLTPVHTAFAIEESLYKIYKAKTSLNIGMIALLGVLANYLVCMGVFLAYKATGAVNKYLSLFFPICIFCVLGFEHSIANMFTLFYAVFVNGSDIGPVFLNILFATLGNVAGGVLFALTTKIKKEKVISSADTH